MDNKIIANDSKETSQDKRAITGTDSSGGAKRGLDVNVINEVPIEFVESVTPGASVFEPYKILAVAKDTETSIMQYTVPPGKRLVGRRISVTGDNRAIFKLYENNVFKEEKNTWWSDFNAEFELDSTEFTSGKVIKVTVEHYSNYGPGDFSATLKGALFDG